MRRAIYTLIMLGWGVLATAQPNVVQSPEWNQLLEDVLREFPALQNVKGLQLLTIPQEANWDDPTYGDYYAWQVIGNTIPSWGSVYAPTAKRVTDAYFMFITNLDITQPTPHETAAATKTRDEYLQAHQRREAILRDASSYDGNGALRPQARTVLAQVEKAETKAVTRYAASLTSSLHGYAAAAHLLLDYDNPAFQREARSPDGLKLPYRTFAITPDLATWKQAASGTENKPLSRVRIIHHYLLQRVPGAFKPNREPGEPGYDSTQPPWGPFISFETQLVQTPEEVALMITDATVSARRVGVFTITPGQWMHADAIQAFKVGPFIDGPVKAGTTALWGEQGVLNLLPAQIIVVYDPNITFTIPRESFKSVAAALQQQRTITIGPFGFGKTTPAVVELDEAKSEIHLRNSQPKPYVVGIISRVLPDYQ